jgi:hypothetical protein
MTPWRLILAAIGLIYAVSGFLFIFNPSETAAMIGISFVDLGGRSDFRAMYGGLEVGVGSFLLICALRREFVRIGLFASACALVAMATARAVGLMLDGFDLLEVIVLITEAFGGAASTWGALMVTPERDSLPPPTEDPTPDHSTLPPAA